MTTANYVISVKDPWFTLIKSGVKKSEGRLNKGIFGKLRVGDKITWTLSGNSKQKIGTTVTGIAHYKNFADMLKAERLKNTLPINEINTISKGVKDVYYKYYKPADEQNFGVVGIRLI